MLRKWSVSVSAIFKDSGKKRLPYAELIKRRLLPHHSGGIQALAQTDQVEQAVEVALAGIIQALQVEALVGVVVRKVLEEAQAGEVHRNPLVDQRVEDLSGKKVYLLIFNVFTRVILKKNTPVSS